MNLNVVVFPFDQFGSAGTGAGAQLLGDVVREMVDDTEQETRPTRADAFRGKLHVEELAFDTMEQLASWRNDGRKLVREHLGAGGYLLWLAGNHLAVLPVLDQLHSNTLVIQFDAHLDVHAFHDTTPELSHGNFLLHAEKPLPKLINVGHRDLLLTPSEIEKVFEATYSAEAVACDAAGTAKELRKRAKAAKRIWIDLDCDAFDPAYLPAVQHPLPFGLAPPVFLQLLSTIDFDKVIGVSISEFDPGRDVRDTSLNLLGWFLEWMLLKKAERG